MHASFWLYNALMLCVHSVHIGLHLYDARQFLVVQRADALCT